MSSSSGRSGSRGSSQKSVSAGSGRPRSHASAGIGRPPGGWISVSSSAPPRQSSTRRSPSARRWPPAGARVGAGGPGREHAEVAAVRERQPRPDVRAQRAHPALQLGRRAGRVQRAVGGLDLVRVGDAVRCLLDPGRALVERLHQQRAAALLQARGERAVVVAGPDRLAAAQADRPGVEPRGQPHDRDARLGVAGHDRPLDRGRAAPARQQRRVHVEDLVRAQERLLDQHAVGADDERVRLRGRDPRHDVVGVERLGLDQLEAERARRVGDGRRMEGPPPPARAVGAGDDERRTVRARGEPLEHGDGERRGAQVDGAQRAVRRRRRAARERSRARSAWRPCAGRATCDPGSGRRRGGRSRAG